MKAISIVIMIGVLSIAIGCATSESRSIAKAEIISSLESGSRTTTYIALWTLEKNGFTVPKIDFDKSYVEAQPQLRQLTAELAQLSQSKLSELDKSLKYHWQIYSPIWSEGGQGWER